MKNVIFNCICWCLLFVLITSSALSQNVGIGTLTPLYKLDVKNGSINTDSAYRIGGSKVLSADLQNTIVGIGAAGSITTGNYNTATGFESLYSNSTGERNTAFGAWSLRSNISGSYNTAIGKSALHVNSSGNFNTATGYETLYYNTGDNNTGHGYHTLFLSTTGTGNTANGYEALNRNTTGDGNTGIGSQSLLFTTTGSFNTATGSEAMYSNTIGRSNTAYGAHALYGNTNGIYNTAIGVGSLNENITGTFNTALGTFADVVSADLTNATAIGNQAKVDASNKVRIGNISVVSIGGQVGWSTFSDGRYKQNIQQDVPGLSFISRLRPVTYTVNTKSLAKNYYKLNPAIAAPTNTSYRHTGFIAQEVEQTATALGFNFSGIDKPEQPDKLYGLRYADFVVPLVKAVQEQQQQIEDLKKEIGLLKEIIKNK